MDTLSCGGAAIIFVGLCIYLKENHTAPNMHMLVTQIPNSNTDVIVQITCGQFLHD